MNNDLKTRLEAYLQLRRALGFAMRVQERLLRDFVGFVEQRRVQGPVTAQLAFDWVWSTTRGLSSSAQAAPGSVWCEGFLTHLRAFVPSTEVPPFGLLAKKTRPQPHLYSQAQICALLEAARSLGPKDSLRPYTYFTFIGLLASCGLRGGEAIRLDRVDVELGQDPPRLHVRQTKFRKSRLVPVHSTTAGVLRTYSQESNRRGYDRYSDAFFVSEKGGPSQLSRGGSDTRFHGSPARHSRTGGPKRPQPSWVAPHVRSGTLAGLVSTGSGSPGTLGQFVSLYGPRPNRRNLLVSDGNTGTARRSRYPL